MPWIAELTLQPAGPPLALQLVENQGSHSDPSRIAAPANPISSERVIRDSFKGCSSGPGVRPPPVIHGAAKQLSRLSAADAQGGPAHRASNLSSAGRPFSVGSQLIQRAGRARSPFDRSPSWLR